jgi:hypothetical protein
MVRYSLVTLLEIAVHVFLQIQARDAAGLGAAVPLVRGYCDEGGSIRPGGKNLHSKRPDIQSDRTGFRYNITLIKMIVMHYQAGINQAF